MSSSMSSGSSSSSRSSFDGPSTPPDAVHSLPNAMKAARQEAGIDAEQPLWKKRHTFFPLERQERYSAPTDKGFVAPELTELVAPNIESFNALWAEDPSLDPPASAISGYHNEGTGLLEKSLRRLPPRIVFDGQGDANGGLGNRITLRMDNVNLSKPVVSDRAKSVRERRVFPTEARERLFTYTGKLTARLCWSVNGDPEQSEIVSLGNCPVLVRSNRCNLRGMSSRELVAHHEEANEFGGYFLVNGNERLIRYLIVAKANSPQAIERPSFEKRGPSYSNKASSFDVSTRMISFRSPTLFTTSTTVD